MPVYSKVTITFLIDFQEDYQLGLQTNDGTTINIYSWDWVTTRSAGFEVTTGTPTATAGERTAINFEAAFDLDFPSGYVTTQTSNVIEIESETLGLDFSGAKFTDDSGVPLTENTDYEVLFENYTPPFAIGDVETLLARSPHYVYTPFTFSETTKVTIDLKVYTGDFVTDEPAYHTQTITKIRPTTDFTDFNTDISNIVHNYLESTPTIDLTTSPQIVDSSINEVVWVRYTATYTDPINIIADVTGDLAGVDGFDYYLEGVNPTITTEGLTSARRRKVADNGVVVLPFINKGDYTDVEVESFPAGTYNALFPLTTNDETQNFVRYVEVDVDDISNETYFEIRLKRAPSSFVVYTYDIIEECRYNPKTILFKNKYGFYDTLTMFAKSTERLNIEKEDFVNNYVSGGTYSTSKHQNQDINIFATKSITCNSGYIKDTENELYEEMLMSQYVWFVNNRGELTPIKPKTSDFTYKTRINDSLVEYQIEFEYAYAYINNV